MQIVTIVISCRACLLTSNLLTALTTTLIIPLTILFDATINGTTKPASFYVASGVLILTVVAVAYLTKCERDPISICLLKLVRTIVRRRTHVNLLQSEMFIDEEVT